MYEGLLALRGGEAGGEEAHDPRLRAALLAALAALGKRWAQRVQHQAPLAMPPSRWSHFHREVRNAASYHHCTGGLASCLTACAVKHASNMNQLCESEVRRLASFFTELLFLKRA